MYLWYSRIVFMEKKTKTTLDYFSAAFVQSQRKKLETIRTKLEKRQKELAAFPDIGDSPDDSAQEASEFEGNLALKKNVDKGLRDVRRALRRIEKGSYGICKKTKQPIEQARLQLIPEAEYAAGAEPKR